MLHQALLKNNWRDVFRPLIAYILLSLLLFILKKYTMHNFVNGLHFCLFSTFHNKFGPNKTLEPIFFVWKICHISMTIIYIFYKKYHIHRFMTNTFPKKKSFVWKFHNFFEYLYGMLVCIFMLRGYQGAHTKFFERLLLNGTVSRAGDC